MYQKSSELAKKRHSINKENNPKILSRIQDNLKSKPRNIIMEKNVLLTDSGKIEHKRIIGKQLLTNIDNGHFRTLNSSWIFNIKKDGKLHYIRSLIIAFFFISSSLYVQGESITMQGLDFSKENRECYLLKNATKLEQSYKYETNPFSGKQALLLKWNGIKAHWMQISFKKHERPVIPDINKFKINVNGFCPEPTPVKSFNLRLIDAKGEVFQYRKKIHWDKQKKWFLEYLVDLDDTKGVGSWGGNKDRKIDKPVSLLGFSLDFINNSGRGKLYINSVQICTTSDKQSQKAVITGNLSYDLLDNYAISAIRFRNASGDVKGHNIILSREKATKRSFGIDFCSRAPGSWGAAPKLPIFIGAELIIKCTRLKAIAPINRITFTLVDKLGKFHSFSKKVNWTGKTTETATLTMPGYNLKGKKLEQPVRLAGIMFHPQERFSGTLRIDDLNGHFVQHVTDAFRLGLETGNTIHVLKDGEEKKLKVQLTNLLDCKQKINVEFSIADINGKETTWLPVKTYEFMEGETITFPSPKLNRYGIYYIHCKISLPKNPGDSQSISRSIAYIKPVETSPDKKMPKNFVMGINSFPGRFPGEIEREAFAMSLVGARVLRAPLGSLQIADKIIDIFSRYGIDFDYIMSYVRKNPKAGSPDFEKSRKYYRQILNRYKGKIRYWELLNEPDIYHCAPSADEYIKLAQIVREELNKIDPDAKLLSAGFCAFDFPGKGKFQRDVMVKCQDIFDLHSFHGHAPFQLYSKVTIDKLLIPMRQGNNITMPWYSNETALTSANRSEKEQAENFFKKMLFARSRGTVGYNWYNLRDKGENPHNNEHNYGMFTMDFYPKAVYPAFNTLATLFQDKQYVRQLPLPDGIHAYEFKSDQEVVLGAWSENFSQQHVLIKTDATKAELVDLMGNAVPAQKLGDLFILPCTQDVITLRLNGATKVEMAPSIVELRLPDLLMPGKNYPLTCKFYNPFPRIQDYTFALSGPKFAKISPNRGTVKVAPRQTVEWKTTLQLADTYKITNGELIPLMVEYKLSNKEKTHFIQSVAAAQPFTPTLDGEALFELHKKSQVVALYDLDPVNLHMHWRSPDDLSAKVQLGITGNALLLKVNVKDDVHYHASDEQHFYNGDSVQITLKTNEMAFPCELNFYHHENKDKVLLSYTPPGLDINRAVAAKQIHFKFERLDTISTYSIEIPFSALKIDHKSLQKEGFRFNILVNDNDGHGRKGWIRLAPGIGRGGIVYTNHPLLIPKKN